MASTTTCPRCAGVGEIYVNIGSETSEYSCELVTCDRCNGSGMIRLKEEK